MTGPDPAPAEASAPAGEPTLDPFSTGFLLGVLAGEGHFGGDGRQPQITLRMHVRHEGLFRWLERALPGGRLYGPYDHGGRHYFQWMCRGPYLRTVVAPIVARYLDRLDDHVAERFRAMCARYGIEIETARDGPASPEAGR